MRQQTRPALQRTALALLVCSTLAAPRILQLWGVRAGTALAPGIQETASLAVRTVPLGQRAPVKAPHATVVSPALAKSSGRPQRPSLVRYAAANGPESTPTATQVYGWAARASGEPILELTAAAGGKAFCPGWTLSYAATLNNQTVDTLHDLTITAKWGADACCPENSPESAVAGVADATGHAMTWRIASLPAGAAVRVHLRLHSLSTLPSGHRLTVSFGAIARESANSQQRSVILLADRGQCAPTATPTLGATPRATPGETGSPTATSTLMPLRGWFALPLIVQ